MRIAPTALVLALSIGCSVALPSTPAGKAAKASAALVQPGAGSDGTKAAARLRRQTKLKQDLPGNIWQDKYMASIKGGTKGDRAKKARAGKTRQAMKKSSAKPAPAPAPAADPAPTRSRLDAAGTWMTVADISGGQPGARTGQACAMSDDGSVVAFRMPGYIDCKTEGDSKICVNYGATRIYAKNDEGIWEQRGDEILGTGMHNHWEDQNIALSGDGSTVAYGLPHGHFDQHDRAGSLRIFKWNSANTEHSKPHWQRKGSDKHEGAASEGQVPGETGDLYVGWSISLDYTGDTVAFGLPGIWAWHKEEPDLSPREGDGGLASSEDDELTRAQVMKIREETEFQGAVRVFHWENNEDSGSVVNGAWSEKGSQLGGTVDYLHAGKSVQLSSDGHVLAYGVSTPDTICEDEADANCAEGESQSAVRIFEWREPEGEEQCENTPTGDFGLSCWIVRGDDTVGKNTIGNSLAMSQDGLTIAFGGMGEVNVLHYEGEGHAARAPANKTPQSCKCTPCNESIDLDESEREELHFCAKQSVDTLAQTPSCQSGDSSDCHDGGACLGGYDGCNCLTGHCGDHVHSEVASKLRAQVRGTWKKRGRTLGEFVTDHVLGSVYAGGYKHYSISMSNDGLTLAFAVPYAEPATLADQETEDEDLASVLIYHWDEGQDDWAEKGEIKSNVRNDFSFGGGGVSLDKDGDCVAVGFTQVAHDCVMPPSPPSPPSESCQCRQCLSETDTTTIFATGSACGPETSCPEATVGADSDIEGDPVRAHCYNRECQSGEVCHCNAGAGSCAPTTRHDRRLALRADRARFDCHTGDGAGTVRIHCWETELLAFAPPAPPAAPLSAISVHGDPMFKVNGTGTHFWLQAGVLSPLLVWTAPDGASMQLAGKTFHSEDALNQWFSQFVVKQNGETVLDVSVKESTEVSRQLSGTMDVTVDGKAIDHHAAKPARGSLLFSSARASVLATLSKKSDGFADVLATSAGGLSMSIYSSRAVKFNTSRVSKKYMHLNVKFDQGLPKNASGVFTELAGTKKLSEATKALLMPPRASLSAPKKQKERGQM